MFEIARQDLQTRQVFVDHMYSLNVGHSRAIGVAYSSQVQGFIFDVQALPFLLASTIAL